MLDDLLPWPELLDWAPAAAGVLCAALVLLAARWQHNHIAFAAPESQSSQHPRLFGADPFVSGSPSDKRSAPRRRGSPVPVLLCEDGGRGVSVAGAIVDRSRGGLAVAVDAAVPTGAVLGVRAEAYARDMPWVPVRVRYCRRDGPGWVLGCQFLQPPPWSVLLLFG